MNLASPKTILVTGGSSGIGLELVRQLSTKGHTVYSLDKAPLPDVRENAHGLSADITIENDIVHALSNIPGPIDVVINNAGIMRRGGFTESNEDDFDKIFDVHVKGAWLILTHTWHKLSPNAMIVQVASAHALRRSWNPGLYTLAKQTLVEMGRNIAHHDDQKDVRFVFPGPIDTPLARHGVEGEALEEKKKIMQNPQQFVQTMIAFLESNKTKLRYGHETREYTMC